MSDHAVVVHPLPQASGQATVIVNGNPVTGIHHGTGTGVTVGNKTYW